MRPTRDIKVDVLRGFAILSITLNHLTYLCGQSGFASRGFPTLTHFSHSSSAEIFFFLSGYLIGLLYLKREDDRPLAAVTKTFSERAIKLYFYNALLFLLGFAVSSFGSEALLALTRYDQVQSDAGAYIRDFLAFDRYPFLMEILQVYIVFLLAAPVFAYLVRRSEGLALGVLLAGYVVVQVQGGTGELSPPPVGTNFWSTFNPFAWQLLFFGGALLGRWRFVEAFESWCRADARRPLWLGLGFVGLLGLYVVDIYDSRLFGVHLDLPGTRKNTLGPVRLLYAAVTILALFALMVRFPRLLDTLPARWLATIGSRSLEMFAASIVVDYVAASIWLSYGRSDGLYWVLAFGTLAVMIAHAYLLREWKNFGSASRPAPRETPAPAHAERGLAAQRRFAES